MLWIPDVGEKPFSLSKVGKNPEITFDVKGKFTKALSEMKKGELVGVRGPYGNGWDIKDKKNICIVAGGLGLAPVMPVIESQKCTAVYGVRNKDYIKFKKRLEKSGNKIIHTTDDGSFGQHCYACDVLEDVLKAGKYDAVLTCGPEILMKKVVDICLRNKIDCQASLERFMKCGIGICGSCTLDPSGLRVCKDGPVFTAKQLENSEFGSYHRDKSGKKEGF
jgi:dihydroorotate dehydrogenase electron transfer subunit